MKTVTLSLASILLLVGISTNSAYGQITGCSSSHPGASSSLLLLNGTINGQSITSANRTVRVAPGGPISGSFTVSITSAWPSADVMTLGLTPTWGTPATSYVDLGHFATPSSGMQRTTSLNLSAPTAPGTYYIIAAFSGEFTAGQVMSATNWSLGYLDWNTGYAVAEWSASTINTADSAGTVCVNYTAPTGAYYTSPPTTVRAYVPATAIQIVVVSPPTNLGALWYTTVGAQSRNKARQALAFLPNEIWIHAGDSIAWKFATDEIHTVTFLRPDQTRLPFQVGCPGFSLGASAAFDGSTCVTTAPLVKDQSFTVTFPIAGNFKLVCLVHANMTAVVHVLDLSQPLPHDQDFYDDQAKDQQKTLLSDRDHEGDREGNHEGDHERDDLDSDSEHSHGREVTAGTGEISATAGGSDTLSVMRFIRPRTVIHAGETVEWTNSDPVMPHTITFGIEPADPMPPSGNVTLDADGARHAVINSPADSVHSGFIVAAPQDRIGLAQSPLGVTRFRVTFTHTGAFPYICALHDGLGMKGKVIVLP